MTSVVEGADSTANCCFERAGQTLLTLWLISGDTTTGTLAAVSRTLPLLISVPRHGVAVARANLRPDEVGTAVIGNLVQADTKRKPARRTAMQVLHGISPS